MKLIALKQMSTVSSYCQLQSLAQCKLQKNTDISSSSLQPKAKMFKSFKTMQLSRPRPCYLEAKAMPLRGQGHQNLSSRCLRGWRQSSRTTPLISNNSTVVCWSMWVDSVLLSALYVFTILLCSVNCWFRNALNQGSHWPGKSWKVIIKLVKERGNFVGKWCVSSELLDCCLFLLKNWKYTSSACYNTKCSWKGVNVGEEEPTIITYYSVSQKNTPDIFSCNLNKYFPISITFGISNT